MKYHYFLEYKPPTRKNKLGKTEIFVFTNKQFMLGSLNDLKYDGDIYVERYKASSEILNCLNDKKVNNKDLVVHSDWNCDTDLNTDRKVLDQFYKDYNPSLRERTKRYVPRTTILE